MLYSSLSLAAQVASPSAENVATSQEPATQLIDIELPPQPGTNWWLGLEIGLAIVAVIVLLALLYWLRNRYWRSFHLRWQLKSMSKQWASLSTNNSREEALKLYQIFDNAQRHQLLLEKDAIVLKETLEPMCFSQNNASRETLVSALSTLKQALADYEKHKLKSLPGNLAQRLRKAVHYGMTRLQQSKTHRGQNHG
ncbi:DUF4381 domain-containing protein [Hydrogenovibrio kuenenii]|uniref:hypothetical protein n=1 Tax=Hydrogenovibrio kuenenii TaxID=63658 RepID=UPI000467BDE6|nr:hypothetical protein [Hydrogenovibrio kuenenii]